MLIHGTAVKMQIRVSTVPAKKRRCPEAVIVLPIPVRNRDVTVKYLVQTTDAPYINHSIMQAWESLHHPIQSQLVTIQDVQVSEKAEVLTAASIHVPKDPVPERY